MVIEIDTRALPKGDCLGPGASYHEPVAQSLYGTAFDTSNTQALIAS